MYNILNRRKGKPLNMTLGKFIKIYMEQHGLSYEKFGEICGLTKGYISMLVHNRNPRTGKPPVPKIQTYQNIAQGMGITLDDLFSSIDDTPVQINDGSGEWYKAKEEPSTEPQPRKWKLLSAGSLQLTDEQLDKLYEVARVLYPDKFPE